MVSAAIAADQQETPCELDPGAWFPPDEGSAHGWRTRPTRLCRTRCHRLAECARFAEAEYTSVETSANRYTKCVIAGKVRYLNVGGWAQHTEREKTPAPSVAVPG